MRALRIERFTDDASGVLLCAVDAPVPAAGEVLLRVACAGLNPSDARNSQGRMPQTVPPRTSGRDFCGTVEGVTVFGSGGDLGFTRDGTHAELVAIPRAALVPKPASLTNEQAASCGVPYVTAYEALFEKCRLRAGETLLVVGGGAVGQAAGQLARWAGARALLASRRPAVDPGPFHEVLRLEGARNADVVLNTVGGATFLPSTKALTNHGRLASIAADMAHKEVSFDLFGFYRRELSFFGIDSLALSCLDAGRMLRRMLPGFASGALVPPAPQALPLAEGPRAFAAILGGDSTKRVLVLQE